MKERVLISVWWLVGCLLLFPSKSLALNAEEVISLVQRQFMVPSEAVRGEMRVYRGERVIRSYEFIMGRSWTEENQEEQVRIEFNSAADMTASDPDQRYLLKRRPLEKPSNWLYLPGFRRVKEVPYQSEDPLLQSDYLFYDLTIIHDFWDYTYRFLVLDEKNPVIEGEPKTDLVPYKKVTFQLERRGDTYRIARATYLLRDKELEVSFPEFIEISPGCFRPLKTVITGKRGRGEFTRTEFTFRDWKLTFLAPQLFTISGLETRKIKFSPLGGTEK